MTAQLHLIASDLPGRLFQMPRPDADRLELDCASYAEQGVDIMVSLLTDAEIAQSGLTGEAAACEKAGISYRSFPILDFGVPPDVPFAALVDELTAKLAQGRGIALHCRAGIGRSGLLSCALLIRRGLSASDAMILVSKRRGERVPETDAQRRFLADFEKHPSPG